MGPSGVRLGIVRRVRAACGKAQPRKTRAVEGKRMRPKKTILLVDDSEQALSIRKFVLETHGYRVLIALDADSALFIYSLGGIDLVLSDLVMPRVDGNELVRQMKQIKADVPMILISGSVATYDRARHADAFLPKGGCSPVEMLERVRVMITRKRGPKKGWQLRVPVAVEVGA